MTKPLITTLIDQAMPKLKKMGREEIAKAHAVGQPAVYMIGKKIVRELPGGQVEELAHDDT